jgi:hypothetical protein
MAERRLPISPILSDPPEGIQLEILPKERFSRFVQKRYRGIGNRTFERRMRKLARMRRIPPLLRYQSRPYYSPLQIVTFHQGDIFTEERAAEFNRLLALIHEVQNVYIPEIRSNGRIALWIESRDLVNRTHTYPVSAIREWRQGLIGSGKLVLQDLLTRFDISIESLSWWRLEFASANHGLDPLAEWSDLVEKIAYQERQKLRYEALLAQDYRDLGTLMVLLLRDLGVMKPYEELQDIFDASGRDQETGAPHWRVEKFGREHLDDHFYQLELIANDYDINPKPRGIIFTEGDEWRALEVLFRARGFDPAVLGIEFRSIHSIGNFNFHHWRGFLEYMHEKQVIVYFAIDSERKDLQQQIEKFTTSPRLTQVEGLARVLPSKKRIWAWAKSFEESNFTDAEIALGFTALGKPLSAQEVERARVNPQRTKGLAKDLLESHGPLSKPELDIALVRALLATADTRSDLRPVEAFVDEAGRTIALNHQPTHSESIAFNRKSGYLG